jgi:ribosomal protein S18 acetylase RimI-like enzyme
MRLLTSQDAEAFRTLRLEALVLSPESFGAHLDEERGLPIAEFARRIDPTDRVLAFGEFDDQGALTGFMGWFRERGVKSAHRSWLWGSYVKPELRGRGIGAALLKATLGRVREVGDVSQIHLHVGAQNEAARSLYSKFGFVRVALLPESLIVEGRAIDEELWVLRINEKVEP